MQKQPMPAGSASLASLVDLSGKRALVTGGGKGIGEAVAQRLIEAGATVTIADIDPNAVDTAERLGARSVRCDIADTAEVVAAVEAAAGEGSLDILVNNAGIFPVTGPLLDATDEFVGRMLDVNVRANYSVAREAARRMTAGGAIVNLSSMVGVRGGANLTAYATSKAAIIGLTRSFALELGARGIRVNAVAPGIIDTPGVQDQLAPLLAEGHDIAARLTANPIGVHGQADHIARAVLFLVSELSAFVTGQTLLVDGGSTSASSGR